LTKFSEFKINVRSNFLNRNIRNLSLEKGHSYQVCGSNKDFKL